MLKSHPSMPRYPGGEWRKGQSHDALVSSISSDYSPFSAPILNNDCVLSCWLDGQRTLFKAIVTKPTTAPSISAQNTSATFSLHACCVARSLIPHALKHGETAQKETTFANILHAGLPGSLAFVADDACGLMSGT